MKKEKRIWIGLLGVRSLPESEILRDSTGAYVNVVTWASDRAEYQKKAQELMDYLHLKLVDIENPQPLKDRERIEDPELADVVARAKENPNAIMYGAFHTWSEKNT